MKRRAFLMAAGAAALSPFWKTNAQTTLGTLAWVEDVAGGSLWIRELPDGPASQIATAAGLHSPRFSRSGQWIAYKDSDDNQRIVSGDGRSTAPLDDSARALLSGADLALLHPEGVFAPDGQRYVFSRVVPVPGKGDDDSGAGQLCLASLAAPDREPQVLVADANGEKEAYAWTRDGKSIVYWDGNEWGVSPWADGMPLKSVNIESGLIRDLRVSALTNKDMLQLAPTGNKLAVSDGGGRETWAGRRVAVVDLDTDISQRFFPDEIASMCPAWSPDGASIACFAAPDADIAYKKAHAGETNTVILPDGSQAIQSIADSNFDIGGGEEAHVYLQQRKIWLLDATGSNPPKQLTGDPRYRDEEPLWSADGSHILFARMDYEGHKSLWLMEASGANAIQVCRLQIADDFGNPDSWFGYYGYTDWRKGFDWRR